MHNTHGKEINPTVTPIYPYWACKLPPMLLLTCCAHTAQWLMPGISILHAQLASIVQHTALCTMQQPYNNCAIYTVLTITYTMHCYATDQLLSMQCTTGPSPVLVAGVKAALAACVRSVCCHQVFCRLKLVPCSMPMHPSALEQQ